MDDLTDEQLVAAYVKGDKEAFNVLIKRYLTPIFNYALGFVKDAAVAEDITQEVFVKVWKKIRKFNPQYKFKNWLYTVAKNTALDYLKKNRAINFSELDLIDDNLLFADSIEAADPSAQVNLELAEESNMVNLAIDQLSEKHQETIKLRYQDGYKFREIAAIFKESIETVKSRNRRALMKLKKIIKR